MASVDAAMAASASSAPEFGTRFLPQTIFLFSGKRKSGKDYITDIFHKRVGSEDSVIIKISGPIKSHWAKTLNLNLDKLLGDGEYKEKYRMEMCKWGEETRRKDYGYFCRAAIDMYNAQSKKIWIVSDIRRKTDLQWFAENYGDLCKKVLIHSSIETRARRGWVFTPGIDDAETECDLDDIDNWDLKIFNDSDNDIDNIIGSILKLL